MTAMHPPGTTLQDLDPDPDPDPAPDTRKAIPFYEARWNTRWLFIALVPLLLNRLSSLVDPATLSELPPWLPISFGWSIAVFLLVFPIVTRQPGGLRSLEWPSLRQCFVEFLIAVPVLIGTLLMIAALEAVIRHFSPDSSVSPRLVTDLGTARRTIPIYLFLVLGSTLVPLAEEVFFRGFLHNALRARLPWIVAVLVQTSLFAIGHTYGGASILAIFGIGLIATLLYHWRKTLLAPIFLHAGINGITMISLAVAMAAHADQPVLGISAAGDTSAIERVTPGGPSDLAGLQVGDEIRAVNGHPVQNLSSLVNDHIRHLEPGDLVLLTVQRGDQEISFEVVLGRRGDVRH